MRSTPIGYAVRANPIAATLEKLLVGQRSGVRPVRASVFCQNQLKVLRWSVSRNAVSRVVRPGVDGGKVGTRVGAVIFGAHADPIATRTRTDARLTNHLESIVFSLENRCQILWRSEEHTSEL